MPTVVYRFPSWKPPTGKKSAKEPQPDYDTAVEKKNDFHPSIIKEKKPQ